MSDSNARKRRIRQTMETIRSQKIGLKTLERFSLEEIQWIAERCTKDPQEFYLVLRLINLSPERLMKLEEEDWQQVLDTLRVREVMKS